MTLSLKYLVSLGLFFTGINAASQEFIWEAGNLNVFDNREYFNPYTNDQTIFGSMIYGFAGVRLNGNNSFAGGLNYFHESGSRGELRQPDIILFYKGMYRNLSLTMGAFPRFDEIRLPEAILSDTVYYYRPDIEGMSVEYTGRSLRHNVWIDWTGRQSFEKKESFLLGFSGILNRGIFIYRHYFMMNHIAHSKSHTAGEHIRDNGAYSAVAGLDLTSLSGLDTLYFTTGILGSYDRLRSVYDFSWPAGWISEADVNYGGGGIHLIYYTGDRQYIITGDGFYRSGNYARTDLYYTRGNSNISGKVQFSLHFIPGITDLSMSLVIQARMGGKSKR